ncbi:MAG TPA: type VI secretion system tip protein VgrG [Fluviicola sp.]|nr:type VI secretion system tip protein VgrG [Fluviicola sp.]
MSTTTNSTISTFVIKINGTAVPGDVSVLSVSVTKKVNGMAKAVFTVLDGSADTGTFEASSSTLFVPGNLVTIEAGYNMQNALLFSGMITGQNLAIDQSVGSALVVECYDLAIKMTVARNCKTWFNTNDSTIIQSITQSYTGISAAVTSTAFAVPQQIQASVTDWDFIQSLAAANGMTATAVNNKLTVAPPDAQTATVAVITYGNNLMEFKAELNAIHQLSSVKVSSWDYPTQTVQSTEQGNPYAGPGNLSSQTLSQVVGLKEYPMETTASLDAQERSIQAKAELTKSNYAKITGKAKIQGTTLIEPASYIELAGLGTRFNGHHFVSGIEHTLSDGNWISEVALGMAPEKEIKPQAISELPGIKGLYNATVKQMSQDPNNQYLILVTIPVLDPAGTGMWARLSQFYASSGAGAFFLPEVGDEVIVGFLDDHSGSPVILGSLYSNSKNKPYKTLQPQEKNPLKAIVSKSGIALMFDDENKILSLQTPANNTIVLSDNDKSLAIKDQNGNTFTLSESGIVMKSPNNITIQSDQTLKLSGSQGVQIETSAGDLSLQGMNISQTASQVYSANGAEMMDLKSGTEMTLRSAMILIN